MRGLPILSGNKILLFQVKEILTRPVLFYGHMWICKLLVVFGEMKRLAYIFWELQLHHDFSYHGILYTQPIWAFSASLLERCAAWSSWHAFWFFELISFLYYLASFFHQMFLKPSVRPRDLRLLLAGTWEIPWGRVLGLALS